MILVVLFFLICIAGAAAIAVLFRDEYVFKQINTYLTVVATHGDDSAEEYAFRERAQSSIGDLCHLIRSSRDDARMQMKRAELARSKCFDSVLTNVVKKNKRSSRGNRGKK